MVNKEQIKASELINFSKISILLTGRPDVIRVNRVQKKHKAKVQELINYIEYWLTK